MREEELYGPNDLTDFKVDMNGQVQVQVLKGLLVPRGSGFFSVVCVMFSSVHN